jgi:hypothetical protein
MMLEIVAKKTAIIYSVWWRVCCPRLCFHAHERRGKRIKGSLVTIHDHLGLQGEVDPVNGAD